MKLFVYFLISFHIAFYFRNPEFTVRMNLIFPIIPIKPMPEFTVTEHRNFLPDESYIRVAWHILTVLPVPDTSRPQFLTQHDLDGGILRTDSLHVPAALLRGMTVHDDISQKLYIVDTSRVRQQSI